MSVLFTLNSLIFSRKQKVVSSETEEVWGIFKFKKNRYFEQLWKDWSILSDQIPLRTRQDHTGKCVMSLICKQTGMVLA